MGKPIGPTFVFQARMHRCKTVYGTKTRYFVDDIEVTHEEFERVTPHRIEDLLKSSQGPGGHGSKNWPMASDAMLIATKKQQRKMYAAAKAKGVRLDFDKLGRPILESQGHRKQVCEFMGMTDRQAGYGDRVGEHLSEVL